MTSSLNSRVFTCSLDKTIKVWSSSGGDPVLNIGTGVGTCCIAVTASEQVLYCGCSDGTILRIDIANSKIIDANLSASADVPSEGVVVFRGHTAELSTIELTFDETRLVSASKDGTCIVWDSKSGMEVGRFSQHAGGVHDLKLFLRPEQMQMPYSAAGKQNVQLSRYPSTQQSKLVSVPPVSQPAGQTDHNSVQSAPKQQEDEGIVQSLLSKINRLSKANDQLYDAIHDTL
jgi:WD40 repeat protein